MNEFLQATEIIDSTNPDIVAMAAEIAGDAAEDEEVARRCFHWVRDAVRHSADHPVPTVTCIASDVLKHRVGFCYAKSHLLAALLRARGIPTALCYQRLAADGAATSFFLHGLVSVHLRRHGWYRVDPRGNKPGVSSDFTPPVERLPYTPKREGEMDAPADSLMRWPVWFPRSRSGPPQRTFARIFPTTRRSPDAFARLERDRDSRAAAFACERTNDFTLPV